MSIVGAKVLSLSQEEIQQDRAKSILHSFLYPRIQHENLRGRHSFLSRISSVPA